jgi:hypothetical protein
MQRFRLVISGQTHAQPRIRCCHHIGRSAGTDWTCKKTDRPEILKAEVRPGGVHFDSDLRRSDNRGTAENDCIGECVAIDGTFERGGRLGFGGGLGERLCFRGVLRVAIFSVAIGSATRVVFKYFGRRNERR